LLAILSRNKGRVVPREQLLDQVWGLEYYGEARTLDVHISGLRKEAWLVRICIETMIGVGYRFLGSSETETGIAPVSQDKKLALAE
jgi:DNA-binding response OmpR family regulator